MANTVNDVMNVIASPDYGIKNIAGTNQEILAILQGTHNSKNNIYNIVDDVKHLLQKLLVASTEKKPIEVSNKSQKINPKNINDILDETKNIRKSIDNLTKAVIKQSVKGSTPAVAKLTDKASQRVADAMVKNLEKQNKGGGMSALIDAFTKLKDISLKDIFFGNKKIKYITEIFKSAKEDLKIKEKDLNNIIKLINASPQIINSLSKVSRKIKKIIKNDIIKKLSDILIGKTSLLSISQELKKHEKVFVKSNQVMKTIRELAISLDKAMWKLLLASIWAKKSTNNISFIDSILTELFSISKKLTKNKKDIDSGTKGAKSIEGLASSLNKAMRKLFFASLWAKIISNKGVKAINNMLTKLISISKKLTKNKKDIDKGAKAAKNITVLAGSLLVTSIFLSIAIVPALLGALGAKCLLLMIDRIVEVAKKLSNKKNAKNIKNSIEPAIMLTAFSGVIALTSLFLGTIAITGLPAILGSIYVLGIVSINMITFKILDSASKYINDGAKTMIIMGVSLLVFGIALGKINNATKGMSWKQIGMLGTITVGLSVCLAGLGIPTVAMLVMSGSVVLTAMGASLLVFAKSLKTINDLGTVPTKLIHQVLNAMKLVKNFYIEHAFKNKIVRIARRYKRIMRSFASAVKNLAKLKKLGSVPLKLVHQTLNAMRAIGNYYVINPISKKAIKEAKNYKRMMRPFGKTLKHLSKLKKLGSVPIRLVHQTLNAMTTIANYYTNNPIDKKAIKEAKKYKKMLKPFGKTLKYFAALKKLGSVPIKLVHQTLNGMTTIANYYTNNPIDKKVIKQAKRYKRMLKPFGKALKYFAKLKKLGSVPIKLVHQTLNGMTTIANYYTNNPIDKKVIKQARRYKRMLKPFGKTLRYFDKLKKLGTIPIKLVHQALNAMSIIADFYLEQDIDLFKGIKARLSSNTIADFVSSFGKTVKPLNGLKDLQAVPTQAIESGIIAIGNISDFYSNITFSKFIDFKSKFAEIVVNKFTNMAKKIQDNFTNIKAIDHTTVTSIVKACHSIINFYANKTFFAPKEKVELLNFTIEDFSRIAKDLNDKTQGFTETEYNNVKLAVKSMKRIVKFLKKNTLNRRQRRRARKTISLLNGLSSAMVDLSNINPSNMTSIGGILKNTLDGVNTIDLGQIIAVTNMFKAFNGINKSESILNKFTESVKEFTTTCKNLMDAMNYNTDAINNMDTSGGNNNMSIFDKIRNNVSKIENTNTNENTNGIRIANVEELARTIAQQINGVLSVDIPDTQVQLLINGQGGNEWTISRY